MSVNYNKLFYFYQVAKKGNLSLAAQSLYISQPSLSKAVKDLERDLGVQLFHRTNRTLQLTAAGEELFQAYSCFFEQEAEVIQRLHTHCAQDVSQVRFGYMVFDLIYLIPDFLKRFQQDNPGIHVIARPYLERVEINDALLSGKLDLGLKLFTTDELIPALGFQVLEEHHLSIVVSDRHPLASRERVDLQELAGEDFIFLGKDAQSSEVRFTLDWCGRCGFQPRIAAQYDRVESVLTMVQSNAGIALLSDFAPLRYMKGLVNVSLNNAPAVYSGLFWREGSLTPMAKTFLPPFLTAAGNVACIPSEES